MGGYRIGENKYIIYYNFDNVFLLPILLLLKATPFKPFKGQHFRHMPKVSAGLKTNVCHFGSSQNGILGL